MRYIFVPLLFVSLLFSVPVNHVFAQTKTTTATPTCTPILGGGEYACTASISPTPTESEITPSPTKKQTTKGGLTVEKPSKTKTTPSTGPEALSLLGLIPVAAAGFYLRRKTK